MKANPRFNKEPLPVLNVISLVQLCSAPSEVQAIITTNFVFIVENVTTCMFILLDTGFAPEKAQTS